MAQKSTSIRLSADDVELSDALARKFGITRSGAIKMAIRRLATIEGLELSTRPAAKGRAKK